MFDLYYTFSDSTDKKLTRKEKKSFSEWIKNADQTSMNAIFMLIIEHSTTKEDYLPNLETLPYDLQRKGSTITFEIEKLPPNLQQIIYKFSRIENEN